MIKICTFSMIVPFCTLCTQLVSRISQYPCFCKIMFKKNTLFLKKHKLKKIDISLINKINKVCIFYITTPFYTLCTQLVSRISQYPCFCKIILKRNTLFLKKHDLNKNRHFFNKSNKQSMRILHNDTFLYVVHTIGKRKSLVPHTFKSHDV